jgi:hypothetical protein
MIRAIDSGNSSRHLMKKIRMPTLNLSIKLRIESLR